MGTGIYADRPVLAFSSNLTHIPNTWGWMMDGYNSMFISEVTVRYCPGQAPQEFYDSYYSNYVHCNIGEDKSYIGYYNVSLFTNNTLPTYIFTNIR